ncbi:CmpA/NrtA family ABC transporter substrate-binding protein [Candidatus Magnetaquicoccus inordinatus]|uniref:CmpA/NrtA family ABC transporter substrate-binding protein n=1 Tax=Candidatus Magnetaquicoccus inordinatus TaxID=2496818 RepID=UPI00102BB0B7|nr:CmpA/NrtA family ABC transporter substrate-binding protein [Candidatus Magnetaquicoccus inordinatus]
MKRRRAGQLPVVRAGFIPLVDCAILVVAKELGFAAQQGIDLQLSREGAWAAIRDKVAHGVLDCAHMLAGMPLAMQLGVQGSSMTMVAPMALGQGGSAITLAPWLVAEMERLDAEAMQGPRAGRNRALAQVIAARRQQGEPQLRLASVHPFSTHHYALRHWLAEAGVDPDRDVDLLVVPPPRMVESLARAEIAGCCVGEPWNQWAVRCGVGELVVTRQEICPCGPEKVLGMRADWFAQAGELVQQLAAALVEAAQWADQEANRQQLLQLLSQESYLDTDAEIIAPVLQGEPFLQGNVTAHIADYQIFYRQQALLPTLKQGQWLLQQMRRWGQLNAAPSEALVQGEEKYSKNDHELLQAIYLTDYLPQLWLV